MAKVIPSEYTSNLNGFIKTSYSSLNLSISGGHQYGVNP
jgi:hypothetical protein